MTCAAGSDAALAIYIEKRNTRILAEELILYDTCAAGSDAALASGLISISLLFPVCACVCVCVCVCV